MNDDQYRRLVRDITELNMSIERLRLELKGKSEIDDQRFAMLFDWLAPKRLRSAIDTEEIEIPEDIAKLLKP